MIDSLKTFKFYLKYYITNHIIPHIPSHTIRLAWYRNAMGIKIGEKAIVLLGCQFVGDAISEIEIGNYSAIASGTVINASAPVKIGEHVSMASGCLITTTDRDSQCPLFSPRKAPVAIGSYAYIASHV